MSSWVGIAVGRLGGGIRLGRQALAEMVRAIISQGLQNLGVVLRDSKVSSGLLLLLDGIGGPRSKSAPRRVAATIGDRKANTRAAHSRIGPVFMSEQSSHIDSMRSFLTTASTENAGGPVGIGVACRARPCRQLWPPQNRLREIIGSSPASQKRGGRAAIGGGIGGRHCGSSDDRRRGTATDAGRLGGGVTLPPSSGQPAGGIFVHPGAFSAPPASAQSLIVIRRCTKRVLGRGGT